MKQAFNSVIALGVLAGGLWIGLTPSYAKPEYTKKESKACTYCHPSAKETKQLTEAGKYYQEHKGSLEGYQDKAKGK